MLSRAAILIASLLVGCADKTALLIEVTSSDILVPDDVDTLRFEVRASTGQMLDRTFPLRGAWPHSLTVLPATTTQSTDVQVTVTGLFDGTARVRRIVNARFEAGQTRRVAVVLTRDCLDIDCPAGVNCAAGECTDVVVSDGGVDAGLDGGGPEVDAGPIDGGTDGGPPPMDAGRDGGPAPRDAGPPPRDAGSVQPCSSASCAGLVVLSELTTRGPAGAGDEFVEIYNRSSDPVDIGGVEVFYYSSTGTAARRALIPPSTIIVAHGYFSLSSSTYAGPATDMPSAWTTGLADDCSIELRAGGARIDLVGVGSATVVETAPFPGLTMGQLAAGGSYERKAQASSTSASMAPGGADELAGNGHDTGDNTMDLVARTTRQPQSRASAAEP